MAQRLVFLEIFVRVKPLDISPEIRFNGSAERICPAIIQAGRVGFAKRTAQVSG